MSIDPARKSPSSFWRPHGWMLGVRWLLVLRLGRREGRGATDRSQAAVPLRAMADIDHAAIYRSIRLRVTDLVGNLPDDVLDRQAPATPAWRVRDIVAHLAGGTADIVAATSRMSPATRGPKPRWMPGSTCRSSRSSRSGSDVAHRSSRRSGDFPPSCG